MLVIRVEHWPGGDPARSEVLVAGQITQMAKDGFVTRGYSYLFGEPKVWQGQKFQAAGLIRNWPRLDYGPTILVARCLDDAMTTTFGKRPWEEPNVP